MRLFIAVFAVGAAFTLATVVSEATPKSYEVACAGKDYKGS